MEVIGAAGAIVGILDVLGRSITKLHALQKRLQDVPFVVAWLSGELNTARIALDRLQKSLERLAGNEMHHAVVMDLGSSLSCCRMLVSFLEARIPDTDENLDGLMSRLQVVVGQDETKQCLECLSRTLNALNIVKQSLET